MLLFHRTLGTGFYTARGNYDKITKIIESYSVELIEVHKWGFYALEQLIGKEELVKKYWKPNAIKKVLITSNLTMFHPERNPDPPTEEVFKKFEVTIFVPESKLDN